MLLKLIKDLIAADCEAIIVVNLLHDHPRVIDHSRLLRLIKLVCQLVGCPVELFFAPGFRNADLFLLSLLDLQLLRLLAFPFGSLCHLPLYLISFLRSFSFLLLLHLLLFNHVFVLASLGFGVLDDATQFI